ncbi:hypothetical protein F0562_019356 [Nyssa sinensis]|uniref:Uncharacterized protein n=1 Tax=Nyssa sinensis TaxID=561372 RepID=A0A5J4ZG27_9ASTE|nr:hypothetical protein F0562_019356 [Nyssa sinensis]
MPNCNHLQVVSKDDGGEIKWVQTEVDLDNHVIVPDLDPNMDSADKFVEDYVSNLTKTTIDISKPMWDFHHLNVKTSEAHAVSVLRVHHSIGDGTSLMALLLTCTRKASHPDQPLQPPISVTKKSNSNRFWSAPWLVWNTITGVFMFLSTALFLKDTETPLKGPPGVEFSPRRIIHRTVSLDDIKLVKNRMNTTVNDVVVGVAQAGLSRYLNGRYGETKKDEVDVKKKNYLPKSIYFRAILFFNIRPYMGIHADTRKKGSDQVRLGNKIGYVLYPFTIAIRDNPLDYVHESKAIMDRKKASHEATHTFFFSQAVLKFFGIILLSICTVKLSGTQYVLQYSQTKDHVVTIILSAVYTTGWVGMGFSRNGMMLNSSAMVGWINKEGEARIKQYHLRGFESLQVIPDRGELPLTNVPAVVVLRGATIYMAFQLKFAARLTHQPMLLAFASRYPTKHSHLHEHDDKTNFVFDFSSGSGSVSAAPADNSVHMKKTHGVLGLLGWGLVLPYGAIAARYLKHQDPLWYYLHIVIQFVGFLIALAAVVVGVELYRKLHANVPAHRGIGIFVLVLSILQILAFFVRPNKDSKIRKYWNWYHHWVGRIALFFGAVNIVLGIQIGGAGNDWKIGYGFLLATVLITTIVLEVLSAMRRSQKVPPPAFQMNQLQNNIFGDAKRFSPAPNDTLL